jgi:hypothetical protein
VTKCGNHTKISPCVLTGDIRKYCLDKQKVKEVFKEIKQSIYEQCINDPSWICAIIDAKALELGLSEVKK